MRENKRLRINEKDQSNTKQGGFKIFKKLNRNSKTHHTKE
jgi:hypothetical protein